MELVAFLRLLVLYVALLFLDQLSPGGAIRAVANGFAVAMPLMLIGYYALTSRGLLVPKWMAFGYGFLLVGLIASWLAADIYDLAAFFKELLAPLFILLGYSVDRLAFQDASLRARIRTLGWLLVLIPLALWVIQGLPPPGGDQFSIFANRNNAALYFLVLSNLLLILQVRLFAVVALLALVALVFNTMGMMLAIAAALLISLGLRRYLGVYLAAAIVLAFLMLGPVALPLEQRLGPLTEAIAAITELGLWTGLDRLSYGDLYTITGENSDLSLFFRIKHWQDLYAVWSFAGLAAWLFGLGVYSSPLLTEIGLVPHNDYLRLLVESGIVGFAGFVLIIGGMLWSIGRRPVLISTAGVAIYFVTENLLDNFAAMTLFYFFGGYWSRHAAGWLAR